MNQKKGNGILMETKDGRRIISGYHSKEKERKEALNPVKWKKWKELEREISMRDTGTINIVFTNKQNRINGTTGEINPWGHKEGDIGSTIDYCIKLGIFTKKEIAILAGSTISKVASHIYHLENAKGIKVIVNNDAIVSFQNEGDEKFPDLIDDIESHQQEYKSLEKTEQESIVKSRIGQGIFRERLIELWGGCSVTGLSNMSLLRASHIKPWRDCSNSERLDPMNGLLLHPTLDHLFDAGYITFEDSGRIYISNRLSKQDMEILHITASSGLRKVPDGLRQYMRFHREHVFKNG